MKRVYRVERIDGLGMYNAACNCFPEAYTSLGYRDSPNRPTPSNDAIPYWELENRLKWFFGFSSIEQLKSWIDSYEVRKIMGGWNYKVGIYEVDEEYFNESPHQAIFIKSKAKLIQFLNLVEV